MSKLYSRTALFATLCYAAAIAILLIYIWHGSDFEGRSVGMLIIGFPWVLALRSDNLFVYFLCVVLNAATVYLFVLSVVRLFGRDNVGL